MHRGDNVKICKKLDEKQPIGLIHARATRLTDERRSHRIAPPSIIWNRIKAKEADTRLLFGHFKTIPLVLVDKIAFVAAIKAAFFLSRVD